MQTREMISIADINQSINETSVPGFFSPATLNSLITDCTRLAITHESVEGRTTDLIHLRLHVAI